MIPINCPILGEEEKEAVLRVLESGLLTSSSASGGENVQRFQRDVESFLKVKHAVAVNSGTSALFAALLALGVKAGDEVLVPSFTFLATANAVRLAGAAPVFVDIESEHYMMDPVDLKKKITRRSRVVIPVHLYGHPAPMDQITEVAEKHSLAVVEDAAQSLGASYRGRQTGTMGAIGCFSLYPSKVITAGEGGFVSTDDDNLATRLKMLRNHGMIQGYDGFILGANLRLPEMEAAIASVQLGKLPSFLGARRRNAEALTALLGGLKEVTLPQAGKDCIPNWSLYTVAFRQNRDQIKHRLVSEGVGAAVYYDPPVHRTPLYLETEMGDVDLPRTDWASQHVLSLPVHPGVSREDLGVIASALKGALSS